MSIRKIVVIDDMFRKKHPSLLLYDDSDVDEGISDQEFYEQCENIFTHSDVWTFVTNDVCRVPMSAYQQANSIVVHSEDLKVWLEIYGQLSNKCDKLLDDERIFEEGQTKLI